MRADSFHHTVKFLYVRNDPVNLIDPDGRFSVSAFQYFQSSGINFVVDGLPVDSSIALGLLRTGAGVQCPGNICQGINEYGLPMQFTATMDAAYYGVQLPGEWAGAEAAGVAAVDSTNGQSIATNTELGGNIYRMPNGNYSWSLPHLGDSDSVTFNPSDIPAGTDYAGFYHDHGAFDVTYWGERFSGYVGGQIDDIGWAMSSMNAGQPWFLGTPLGRIEGFDPSQSVAYPNGYVIVGPAVIPGPGISDRYVPERPPQTRSK